MTTLIKSFQWNERNFTLSEFVSEYSKKLPTIMMITGGFSCKDEPMYQFGSCEVYWVFAIHKQARYLLSDKDDRFISIPCDYKEKFKIVYPDNTTSAPMSLQRAIKHCASHDHKVQFTNHSALMETHYVGENVDPSKFGPMRFHYVYEGKYLLGYLIESDEVRPYPFVIPIYIPLDVTVAVNLTSCKPSDFYHFCQQISQGTADYDKIAPEEEKGVIVFKEPPEEVYAYMSNYDFRKMVLDKPEAPPRPPKQQEDDACSPMQRRRPIKPFRIIFPDSTIKASKEPDKPKQNTQQQKVPQNALPLPARNKVGELTKQFDGEITQPASRFSRPPTWQGKLQHTPTVRPPAGLVTLQDTTSVRQMTGQVTPQTTASVRPIIGQVTPQTTATVRPMTGKVTPQTTASVRPMTGQVTPQTTATVRPFVSAIRPNKAQAGPPAPCHTQPEPNVPNLPKVVQDAGAKSHSVASGHWKSVADVPEDLSSLTVSEVSNCLTLLHLGHHADKMAKHDIDGTLLMLMDQAMLQNQFSFNPFEAVKLLKFTRDKWRPSS